MARDEAAVDSFQRSTFGSDYWLAHCEGFRVLSSGNERVGIVEHLVFATELHRPDALVVRAGRFRRRRITFPVSDVRSVDPRKKTVVVGGAS
jgi:hypothetical protein